MGDPFKSMILFLHALMVGDGAFSHKIHYNGTLKEILNIEGHPNSNTGPRASAILLKGWILPIGEVASGRVCACSLRSRLVMAILTFSTSKSRPYFLNFYNKSSMVD